jgi:hypothetical protein
VTEPGTGLLAQTRVLESVRGRVSPDREQVIKPKNRGDHQPRRDQERHCREQLRAAMLSTRRQTGQHLLSEFSEAIVGEAEAFAKGALSGPGLVRLDVLLAGRLLLPTFPAPTADR